jgi:hypothetical protein
MVDITPLLPGLSPVGGKAMEELARALHLAKVTGAVLVIAKLDRLSSRCQRSDGRGRRLRMLAA